MRLSKALTNESYEEIQQVLEVTSGEELMGLIIQDHYNGYLEKHCDNGEEKRVPYIGWFWRDVDFVTKQIPIGVTNEGYVGVMAKNKWGYPQRMMTSQEADQFIEFIDSSIIKKDVSKLDLINEWMQELKI